MASRTIQNVQLNWTVRHAFTIWPGSIVS
jgi:hypothetical protein